LVCSFSSSSNSGPEEAIYATAGGAFHGGLSWATTTDSAGLIDLRCYYRKGDYLTGLDIRVATLTAYRIGSLTVQ
jgi:hypothetical protein